MNKKLRFDFDSSTARIVSNGFSTCVLAVSGLAISTLLGRQFGVLAVGQLNQLATIHIIAGQIAAFGIHLSCLRHLSNLEIGTYSWNKSCKSALQLVFLTGLIAIGLVYSSANFVETAFSSPGLSEGIQWTAFAIGLFGFNKVVISILNAADHLHTLAYLQMIRPLVWVAGTIFLVIINQSHPSLLGQLLFAGELAGAFVGVGLLVTRLLKGTQIGQDQVNWLARHAVFSWRAMPSHLAIELNTRIDVLVLSVFVSPALVGIYSFAALLMEGVFQIGVVFRTVLNRRLTRSLADKNQNQISSIFKKWGSFSLWATLFTSMVLGTIFVPMIDLLSLDPGLKDGLPSLIILLVGATICARYSPFWMSLALGGHPLAHTRLMLQLCGINVFLNLAFVPFLGILGAALGTSIMLVLFPVLLKGLTKKTLGLELR